MGRDPIRATVNDSNKFAAVIEGIEIIAELICRYAIVEDLYPQSSSAAGIELEKALVKLYAAILTCLSRARRYLEERKAARIMKSGLSPGNEFDDYLENIRLAREEVRQCTDLADRQDQVRHHGETKHLLVAIDAPLRRIADELKDVQDQLQTSKRTRILQWISPEPHIQYHEQAKKDILPGTGQWVLSDVDFVMWRNDSASSILWLHGIPGSGKSKLVSIVIEDALRSFHDGLGTQPAYFYCSRNTAEPTRSDPEKILASIARQLSSFQTGKALLSPATDLYKRKEAEGFASGPLRIEESC
ncbi:hypothetical protein MMC10_008705 [Thelotrema lepadinum]|nr:hypothetical protein [Thelotrema lepadinum]